MRLALSYVSLSRYARLRLRKPRHAALAVLTQPAIPSSGGHLSCAALRWHGVDSLRALCGRRVWLRFEVKNGTLVGLYRRSVPSLLRPAAGHVCVARLARCIAGLASRFGVAPLRVCP